MSCLRRCLAGIIFTLLICLLALAGLLFFASYWLSSSDAPEKADAIVVLAGDPRRALHAADLLREGYAGQVLISLPARDTRESFLDRLHVEFPRQEDVNTRVLEKAGVERERIGYFGAGSISTFEEACALAERYAGQSPRLLVVTSPYHVRRARMILAAALPKARLNVVATPYEEFSERWWTSQEAARNLFLELAKLILYTVGGRYLASPA